MLVLPKLEAEANPNLTDIPAFKKVFYFGGPPVPLSPAAEPAGGGSTLDTSVSRAQLRQTKSRLWVTNEQAAVPGGTCGGTSAEDAFGMIGPMVGALRGAYQVGGPNESSIVRHSFYNFRPPPDPPALTIVVVPKSGAPASASILIGPC